MIETHLQKRVSREQFALACQENKSKGAVCRALGISTPDSNRLERLYDIDLPSKNPGRTFDYDEIYEIYLKNERNSQKTAKIIGCHFGTVLKIARQNEEGNGLRLCTTVIINRLYCLHSPVVHKASVA